MPRISRRIHIALSVASVAIFGGVMTLVLVQPAPGEPESEFRVLTSSSPPEELAKVIGTGTWSKPAGIADVRAAMFPGALNADINGVKVRPFEVDGLEPFRELCDSRGSGSIEMVERQPAPGQQSTEFDPDAPVLLPLHKFEGLQFNGRDHYLCGPEMARFAWTVRVSGNSDTFAVVRESSDGTVSELARIEDWRPLYVGGLRGASVEANRYSGGCFAAVYDPANAVLTTVEQNGDSTSGCVDLLTQLVRHD